MHVEIDPAERQASTTDEEIALRLRKAYFHIAAVLDLPFDTPIDGQVLHFVGPDIRTAMRHLTPIASRYIQDQIGVEATRTARQRRELTRRLLDACSHPTPQTLILPRHLGGLDHADPDAILAQLHDLLATLTLTYVEGLSALADRLDAPRGQGITNIMVRCGEEIASRPADMIASALARAESQDD